MKPMPLHDPWAAERRRYEEIRRLITERLERLAPAARNVQSDVVELRRSFWDDVSVDNSSFDDLLESHFAIRQQAEILGERERTHRSAMREIGALRRLLDAPYFGFIAFREQGEPETQPVYIGSSSLLDDDGETFLIYDWRAPVASMYYDYPPGEASYETPGGTVSGVIERKLQFLTERGELVGIFDSAVTIGDSLLARVLAQTSDARMKTIVSTIQREQNAAIRNDDKRLLVVHGPAGSGKTSAALQRVAYLLYKHRDTLQSDHMLLFSPNSMFMSYVDSVLPELGEDKIAQETFHGYLQSRLGNPFTVSHPFDELETLLASDEEEAEALTAVTRLKSDPDFLDAIGRYLDRLPDNELRFRPIRLNGADVIGRERLAAAFAETDASRSLAERLADLQKRLLRELTSLESAARNEDWVTEALDAATPDMLRKAWKELRRRQKGPGSSFNDRELEERILREMIAGNRFDKLRRRVKRLRFLDLPALYVGFLRSCHTGDPAWAQGAERTSRALGQGVLPFEDAVPFLHMVGLLSLSQPAVRRDVRHVLVDEAQDFSLLQLEWIKRQFPNARMTIVGDFRQAIFPYAAPLYDAAAASRLHGAEHTAVVEFHRCYRSTRELVEFTRQLTGDGGAGIEPFDRAGEKPVLVRAAEADDIPALAAQDIRRLQAEGFASVAVIAKTAEEALRAFERLQPSVEGLSIVTKETEHFPKGVCVVPSYLAKGVEFDAVLIWDASASAYGRERERKLFYTACTRAMHRLVLYAAGEPSPFLAQAAPDTYIVRQEDKASGGPSKPTSPSECS